MASWSAFFVTVICLLAGLCYVKQRRVNAEDELFKLATSNKQEFSSNKQELFVPSDPRLVQTQTLPQYETNLPPVLSPAQQQFDANSVRSGAPSTVRTFQTGPNLDKRVSTIQTPGTSYYPPSNTSFEVQGPRWAPAT